AVDFAGGTDAIAYSASGWDSRLQGCFAFRMKTTQATANALAASVWDLNSRNGLGFILNNTANKLSVGCWGVNLSIGAGILTSTTTVNDGNWHTIAFNWNTVNGGANALFVDGAQEATANSSGDWPITLSSTPMTLGSSVNAFCGKYVGSLAEVAAWSRQLNADEIA